MTYCIADNTAAVGLLNANMTLEATITKMLFYG